MANFSSISNYLFPSPTTARSLHPNNIIGHPLSQQSIISSTISGIQFPSPIYQSVSTFTTNSVQNSVFRPPLLQSSSFDVSSTTSTDWIHCVPSTLPWASSKTATGHSVVLFTATSPTGSMPLSERMCTGESSIHTRSLKRRAPVQDNDVEINTKVFVNEDRVAEGMRNLQLGNTANNNSNQTSNNNENWYQSCTVTTYHDNETGEMEDEPLCTSSPTIQLSEELRVGFSKKDIVQQLISDELTKSCKQIVLWTPPGHGISQLLSGYTDLSKFNRSRLSRDMDVIDMGISRSRAAKKSSNKTCESGLETTSSTRLNAQQCNTLPNYSQSSSDMDITSCTQSANGIQSGLSPVMTSRVSPSQPPPRRNSQAREKLTAGHLLGKSSINSVSTPTNFNNSGTTPTIFGLNNNNVRSMNNYHGSGGVYTSGAAAAAAAAAATAAQSNRNRNVFQSSLTRQGMTTPAVASAQIGNQCTSSLSQSATSLQVDPSTFELMDDDDLDW